MAPGGDPDISVSRHAALNLRAPSTHVEHESATVMGDNRVRMFTEQYLGGEASFMSSHEGGTTFSVWIPRTRDVSKQRSGVHVG